MNNSGHSTPTYSKFFIIIQDGEYFMSHLTFLGFQHLINLINFCHIFHSNVCNRTNLWTKLILNDFPMPGKSLGIIKIQI